MDTLDFYNMRLTWMDGGITSMDGGAMFGVVPKPLWSRKYPFNEKNQIELPTDSILIQYQGKNYMIDAGVGKGKLTDRQKRNFGVREETEIQQSLAEVGLTVEDIDFLLMTHLHFDHAGGLTHIENEELVSTFPNATIYVNAIEWDEIRNPNIRSKSTYWKENWEPIQHQVTTYQDSFEVVPGIEMIHTGGHSAGHAIIKLTQENETMLHMADIMPTHAHQNPLWVLAYDDYPMTSVFSKEKWMKEAYENQYSFVFYHDAYYRMMKWDKTGKEVVDSLKRSKKAYITFD
ncbi:YtnP family quorum-quenching lactonase [Carnobacterium antarcticum]|uniref:MBL fold metallo-hydrolase n=1 Tax=Carnobacterium antarcticum TaxID=2126436 RepID=A0ABW4NL97_9LACT|nr:MBL fold metallo-hydrolase [Carnobacterium sp. CP1]ALV22094.1 metallo-beta-lactamase family protein [Carnobacterium sp. CP1]